MFRSVDRSAAATVNVYINGEIHQVAEDSSVWAAMALAGATETRKAPLTEKPRSAYCAMGVCFECLVEIDGMPNRQACLTQVTEGMQIWQQSITEATQAEQDSVQEDGQHE